MQTRTVQTNKEAGEELEDSERRYSRHTQRVRGKKKATYRFSHSLEGGKWDRTTKTGLDASTSVLQLAPQHCMLPAVTNPWLRCPRVPGVT